jgi:hypothetical protein
MAIARALSLVVLVTSAGVAQEHAIPNEQLGTVHFATSCRQAVEGKFDRAIALLHSFEFGEAYRGFNDVLAVDSTCAMAHWGIALTRWTNPMAAGDRPKALLEQGRRAAETATRLGARATEREQLYIAAVGELFKNYERGDQRTRALAYERAMSILASRQPADTEAQIFYAISLVATALPTDKTFANQLKAAAILEPIFAARPTHPGLAHYLIHTYDYPELASRAAKAAERYSSIAPSAAHAQHMPSHTFTRVGQWPNSVAVNRRSMALALRDASIAEVLHAADYAVYAYLQMRNDAAAKRILDSLPLLAARFDVNAVTGAAPGSAGVFALAAIPARYALERRAWPEAAALEPASSKFPWTEAMVYFARALGASHSRNPGAAQPSIDSLSAIRNRLRTAGEGYWAEQVDIQRLGATAWLHLARGRRDSALFYMREAVKREDATDKNAVTPGPLAPARELLGDMLMQLTRPSEALAEYRATLLKEPNRYRTLDGARRAAAATGDRTAESQYAAALQRLTGRGRP